MKFVLTDSEIRDALCRVVAEKTGYIISLDTHNCSFRDTQDGSEIQDIEFLVDQQA